MPDQNGFFGAYVGQYLPPELEAPFAAITKAYRGIENDAAFIAALRYLSKHFQGRPAPVCNAHALSLDGGGAQLYLKREALDHTGAHKLDHCAGEGEHDVPATDEVGASVAVAHLPAHRVSTRVDGASDPTQA